MRRTQATTRGMISCGSYSGMDLGDRTDRGQKSMGIHRFLTLGCPIIHTHTRVLYEGAVRSDKVSLFTVLQLLSFRKSWIGTSEGLPNHYSVFSQSVAIQRFTCPFASLGASVPIQLLRNNTLPVLGDVRGTFISKELFWKQTNSMSSNSIT